MDLTQADEHLNFVVHNYTSTSRLTPSPTATIGAGRKTIDSAYRSEGWSTVNWDFDEFIFNSRRNAFCFAHAPPASLSKDIAKASSFHSLKEWGAPVDDADGSFALENVPEFQSTNLEYLLFFARAIPVGRDEIGWGPRDDHFPPVVNDNDIPPTDHSGLRLAKKRRLDNDFLHDVIPHPHYRPSVPSIYPSLDVNRITAYVKSQPIPIPPYHVSKVQDYLNTPYARSAWILPIRGILPWEGCTSAMILDGSENAPPSGPTTSSQYESHITWTHASLTSFWDFLLAIQRAKTLGPISISFHAAPLRSSVACPTSESDSSVVNARNTSSQKVISDSPAPLESHMTLSAVDHIKVYHDVMYAMYLRNALDAWRYYFQPSHGTNPRTLVAKGGGYKAEKKPEERGGESEGKPCGPAEGNMRKVRLLKGAILVLIDDSLNGLLLS